MPSISEPTNSTAPKINHITLVRPPVISSLNSFSAPATAPLALAYLSASLLEAGFEVTPIDGVGEAIEQILVYEDPVCRVRGLKISEILERIPKKTSLIAVSCMFSQEWLFVRKIISAIKEEFPDIPVILGGEHATAIPVKVLETTPEIELCAIGEGESAIVDIARNFFATPEKVAGIVYRAPDGTIVQTPRRPRIEDLESIPRPAWDLLPLEAYLGGGYGHGINDGRSMPILATRGCPFQCAFCSSKEMWTQRYHARDPRDVVDEIEGYVGKYKIDTVEFFDLTAVVKKDWIMEFGRLLKERKLNISWSLPSGTRSEALDEEVTKLMAETNCKYLVYAAESGSPKMLEYIKKKIKLDRMLGSMRSAKRNGLSLRCNLIAGFPKETRWDTLQTIWFQMKLAIIGVDDAPIYLFSPYPGSDLFRYLQETGRIPELDDDYYRTLLCQMDLTKSSTYCENMGPRELVFYRVTGMCLFYGLSYLLRPARIFRSLKNIFVTKRTATVFEQRLVELLKTVGQIRKNQAR